MAATFVDESRQLHSRNGLAHLLGAHPDPLAALLDREGRHGADIDARKCGGAQTEGHVLDLVGHDGGAGLRDRSVARPDRRAPDT